MPYPSPARATLFQSLIQIHIINFESSQNLVKIIFPRDYWSWFVPISRLQYESNNKKSDAGGSSSSNMSRLPIIRSLAEIGRIHSSNKSKLTCWVTQNLFVHFPKRDTLSYRILENRAKLIIPFDDFIDRKAIRKSRLGNVRNVNKPARWY